MAWVVRRDHHHVLVPVPIQSPLGSELLEDIDPPERLRSAHVVRDDGRRRSAGAAAAEVLAVLPRTQGLAGLADRLPNTTALLYRVVANRRKGFGRLVSNKARLRADRLLHASSVTTATQLEARSRSPT